MFSKELRIAMLLQSLAALKDFKIGICFKKWIDSYSGAAFYSGDSTLFSMESWMHKEKHI